MVSQKGMQSVSDKKTSKTRWRLFLRVVINELKSTGWDLELEKVTHHELGLGFGDVLLCANLEGA